MLRSTFQHLPPVSQICTWRKKSKMHHQERAHLIERILPCGFQKDDYVNRRNIGSESALSRRQEIATDLLARELDAIIDYSLGQDNHHVCPMRTWSMLIQPIKLLSQTLKWYGVV